MHDGGDIIYLYIPAVAARVGAAFSMRPCRPPFEGLIGMPAMCACVRACVCVCVWAQAYMCKNCYRASHKPLTSLRLDDVCACCLQFQGKGNLHPL